MPFPNEHACRLHKPGRYDRFRRANGEREHDGKKYDVIFGKVKGTNDWEDQAYRYPKKTWTATQARSHCKSHKGILFEPASDSRDAGTGICVARRQDREDTTMPDEHNADGPPLSPFWSIYKPAFERLLASVNIAAGPVKNAKASGLAVDAAGGVAIVGVRGPLEKRGSWLLSAFGGSSYLSVRASLNAAMDDKSVEEIMLLVDSPGGSVDGLADLGDFLRDARGRKSVTSFIDGMGASAGYYLAAQGSEVVASRTSLVGSIGTIATLYDLSEQFKKAGIEPVVITTGPLKGTGVPGAEVTDEQKKELQDIVDFYFDDFKAAVLAGRDGRGGLNAKTLKPLATGGVWDAPEAMKLGLVDRLGTFEETVAGLQGRVAARARHRRLRAENAAFSV